MAGRAACRSNGHDRADREASKPKCRRRHSIKIGLAARFLNPNFDLGAASATSVARMSMAASTPEARAATIRPRGWINRVTQPAGESRARGACIPRRRLLPFRYCGNDFVGAVATILEIARQADVSPETVLRVLNGEPVNSYVANRVADAIKVLGSPPVPSIDGSRLETVESARQALTETFAHAAAELEASLPQGVGSVVYEALRLEVRPVAQHLSAMGPLIAALTRRLEEVASNVGKERQERLQDLALVTTLITDGWRSVDRRLGRVERMLERLEEREAAKPAVRVVHTDVPPKHRGELGSGPRTRRRA
jgi:hypothetical protein